MLRYVETANARPNVHSRVGVLNELALLDPLAQKRLAQVPVVLLDAKFDFSRLWVWEGFGFPYTNIEDSAWIDGYDLHVLARSLFTFAWHLTRARPDAVGIVLGMSEQTMQMFARLPLRSLERVILQRSHCVRPRWEQKPERWTKLIDRARKGDSSILNQHALQLLYGDLFDDLK